MIQLLFFHGIMATIESLFARESPSLLFSYFPLFMHISRNVIFIKFKIQYWLTLYAPEHLSNSSISSLKYLDCSTIQIFDLCSANAKYFLHFRYKLIF